MKKTVLLISVLAVVLLSGCARKQSDSPCLYCGSNTAYDYEIDGNTVSLCNDCYKMEMEQNRQVKEDLKNGIN